MRARKQSVVRAAKREANRSIPTRDAFANFQARLGTETDNQSHYGTYTFNPITRNRILLDAAYRGSWICRMAVRAIADDMTREGITLTSDMDPEHTDMIYTAFNKKYTIWDKLAQAIGWGRLYGGGGAIVLIDGQDFSQPLRLNTIGKGQFAGLMPVDRWMVWPSLNDLVTDFKSHDLGLPKYYTTVPDAPAAPRQKIHYSRFIRFEGDDLPHYQRLAENLWSLSVLEPIFDRILAFDSATTGTAQLVYKAHIRTYGIKGLRQIIAKGGTMLDSLIEQVNWMRAWQSNEGITLMDSEDEFQSLQYSFGGLDAVLLQMGQQISGALQIPLVRLFGQSPAGLNATGESDLRTYYDGIKAQQERRLRHPLEKLVRIIAISEGIKLPNNFNFDFVPLWQLTAEQKSNISSQTTTSVMQAFEGGVVGRGTVLKELRKLSTDTGIWTSITDEEIEEAEKEPLNPMGQGGEEGLPGLEGLKPPQQQEKKPDNFLPGDNVIRLPVPPLPGRPVIGEGRDVPGKVGFLPGTSPVKPIRIKKNKDIHVHVNDRDMDGEAIIFAGFPVIVEFKKGQERNIGSSDGAIMPVDYGYIPGTTGHDGDSVDVFLGDNDKSDKVFVIEQGDPDTKEFHQHKIFLGFDKSNDVEACFHSFYNDGRGPDRLLSGNELTLGEFKTWLMDYKDRPRRRVGR